MSLNSPQTSVFPAFAAVRGRVEELSVAFEDVAAALADTRAELASARMQLEAERERREAACAELERVTSEFDRVIDETHREHAATLERRALAGASLPLDELMTVFLRLARAGTSRDVTSVLVESLAREFTRVVLVEPHGGLLEPHQETAFPALALRAIQSGQFEVVFADSGQVFDAGHAFGGAAACGLALPLIVRGVTVAVIYADDADAPASAIGAAHARAMFAELLWRHASLVLGRVRLEPRPQDSTGRGRVIAMRR